MSCSSFEPKLPLLLDGELVPRERAALNVHLEGCLSCRGLLDELRIVDALLLGPRAVEPAPNFTYKLMAEIHSMAPPKPSRLPLRRYLAVYLGATWIAILAVAIFAGAQARAVLAAVTGATLPVVAGFDRLAHATLRGFGHGLGNVTALTLGVLALDGAVALAIAFGYLVVRPRLAAGPARSEGSR